MARAIAEWYIENVHTKDIKLLEEGKFTIGRGKDNDLTIDGRFKNHCSRKHCIIILSGDTVRILNRSQYGTYINAIRVSDQQIHNGDIISLVDRGNIPDPNCHDYDFLSFILRRIEFNESMSQSDDEASQVIVSSNSSGEILVSTNTISIDLTKDSDDDEDDSDDEGDSDDEDEDDFKAKFKGDFKDRFAEDYEVGEPSSKHLDSDQESKPTTKPSSNPKRPKDPVDKALEELNAKIAAYEAKRQAIAQENNTPMCEPVVQKDKVEENKFAELPFKTKRRIAHVPKDPKIVAQSPNVQPPTPPNDPKKRATKRAASPPDHQNKRANISIDSILTPPSGESSPAQQVVVPENDAANLTRTIVGWKAANMMDKIHGKCPQQLVVPPPNCNFGDFSNHASIQTNILKCNLWHYLQQNLQRLPNEPGLRLLTSKNITVTGHRTRLIYSCQAPCNLGLQYGFVLVVNATVSSGSKICQFLGFIINHPQKIDANNMHAFELEVVPGLSDDWRVIPKATIVACFPTDIYVTLYETIFNARNSNLFEAIINPKNLRDFTQIKQHHFDRRKCITQNLDSSQYDAIEKICNNTFDALQRCNAFAMAINGGPGSGKSCVLLEVLIALVRLDTVKQRKFKILVTGNSDDTVDSLALKLHRIRSDHPKIPADLYQKLDFFRYRTVNNIQYRDVRKYMAYERAKVNGVFDAQTYCNILCTANIVFAPVKFLPALTRYCDKFDVILFDNASEMNEIFSTLPFILSPSSFIMFGDRFRSPKDPMDLKVKYPTYNLNQSMFARLVNGNRCVVNLRYTYRFQTSVINFLNEVFYSRSLTRLNPKTENFKGFGLFHRSNDSYMFWLLEQFMQFKSPADHRYAIILPPNITQPGMDQTLGKYKPLVMLSRNQQFTIEEKDIIIVWVNESSKNMSQYRMANMWNVLTRAKEAVYFIGCTAMLCGNENWREVRDFARRSSSEFDLNGKEVSLSDIKTYMQ